MTAKEAKALTDSRTLSDDLKDSCMKEIKVAAESGYYYATFLLRYIPDREKELLSVYLRSGGYKLSEVIECGSLFLRIDWSEA